MLKYLIISTAALVFGALFTSQLTTASSRYKILKVKDVPLVGGLGLGLTLVFSLCLGIFIVDLSIGRLAVIAAASLLMLFLGIIDDLKELSIPQKIIGQSSCAILLISQGITTDIMYFGFWGNAVITFLWILGITNAFNLLDIVDGLAAGTTVIVSAAFLAIGFLSADLNVQVLSLILCASCAGFLIFNLPPAKAYLGNSGSHFLGLLIACIALITHYASVDNTFALFSPVMILGLPIIDTVLLVIFRMIKGRPPFKKSRDHVALKIGAMGFSPAKTLLIMYALSVVFAACGVALAMANNASAAVIVAGVFLLGIIMFLRLVKIKVNG